MLFNLFKKKRKLISIPYFSFSLVEHCNLNCKYCDHFVPLAKESYADLKELEQEFLEVSKILYVKSIGIMGGEPLLHPEVNTCLQMMRKIFPKTELSLCTNGILLSSCNDDFWQSCKDYNIRIVISKYPININFDLINEKAKKYNVYFDYYLKEKNQTKKMYKMSLDLSGTQNIKEMHNICWKNKGSCVYYRKGKLYKCTTAANIHNFNDYFNTNIKLSKNDYIEISKIESLSDLSKYFYNPIPFCKYCNLKNNKYDLDFELSEKNIKEWTD